MAYQNEDVARQDHIAPEDDVASRAGGFFGFVAAILWVAALLGGFSFQNVGQLIQFSSAPTQQVPSTPQAAPPDTQNAN
jgi:hypothetical protein